MSVFLQAPKHSSWHTLLFQSDFIGLQVHLILILFLAQLDLLRVGLLSQLC